MLDALGEAVAGVDADLARATYDLRWGPLNAVFELLSHPLVKGPLLLAAAALYDLWQRRRLPLAALTVALAWGVTSVVTKALKALFDRERPFETVDGAELLGALPRDASFPSGHASSAFACAVAVALLCPRLRAPALALAALVALSRVYLAAHFYTDVVAGALLGAVVGAAFALAHLSLASRRAVVR